MFRLIGHRFANLLPVLCLCISSPAWGQDKGFTGLSLKSAQIPANKGDAAAQYNLGLMYSAGRGVPMDYAQAIESFRKAAENGNAGAQLNLARLYASGLGTRQDFAEAAKWFRMAAEQGNADAQYDLGLLYSKGQGVPKDDTQATSWLRKAAEQGNVKAQLQLSIHIEKATSQLINNDAESLRWLRQAADQGNPVAEVKIAAKYRTGTGGLPRDDTKAARWLSQAAEQGDVSAKSDLVVMYKQGTPMPTTTVKTDVEHWAHTLGIVQAAAPPQPSSDPPSPGKVPPPSSGSSGSTASVPSVTDRSQVPEIAKKDCQNLVDGQLVFAPSQTMRQGQPSPVFARLSRNSGVEITQGLSGAEFIIVREKVSCKVSMSLDSEEADAFTIEKVPKDRPDAQLLEPDNFSQWDWRVTPLRHGPLNLLLYVTPMLYVDGIGEQLKEFRQPPRTITVNPDYIYQSTRFVKSNWGYISGIPAGAIFLWFRKQIVARIRPDKRAGNA